MFSTTIKRSVATLGVVAGLLAAAVPASAIEIGTTETLDMNVKAPTNAPAPIDSGPGDDNIWNNGDGNDVAAAKGTQVGSEGVKAPKPSDADRSVSITNGNADDQMAFSPQAPTSDGLISVTADAGSGNDNLRGEAIDIIP